MGVIVDLWVCNEETPDLKLADSELLPSSLFVASKRH